MIGLKSGQIIMAPALYPDECNFPRHQFLQLFTMPDRYEPIFCSMQYVGVAVNMLYPFIGAQMIAQQPTAWEYGKKPFHHFYKTIIRCIENKVTRFIITCNFTGKATAHTTAIYNYVVFVHGNCKRIVHKLHILQHFALTTFAGTFPKATIIHQNHIILKAVEIACIFSPTLYATAVAMKI